METEIKVYAPVVITTLCRYEHFKRCIESLSRCIGAEYTEVYIGLDYPAKEAHWEGYKKIKEYLGTCGNLSFKKLIVIRREKNYGVGTNGNYASLRNMVFNIYDRLISSEDDNEFSPYFLDFVNKALQYYWDDMEISSVCGYTHIQLYGIANQGVLYSHFVTAWGIGLWKHKESTFDEKFHVVENYYKYRIKRFRIWLFSPILYRMMCNMVLKNARWGDVMRSVNNVADKRYQIRPYMSMVRNHGFDASGEHCSRESDFANQTLLEKSNYEIDGSFQKVPWRVLFLYKLGANYKTSLIRALKDLIYVIFPRLLEKYIS